MICEILKKKKNQKDDEDNEENEGEDNDINNKTGKINLYQIIDIKYKGDIKNISKEVNKLLEKPYIFDYIELGYDFWTKYSEYFNKEHLNILYDIKNILLNIREKKKEILKDIDFIYKFIHETGVEKSKKKKFRNNIELLEFVKDKDIYYTSKKYKNFRDVEIFVGLNFLMDTGEKKEFIKLWNEIDFNNMFEEEQYLEFQKIIISHISHISIFHLLFQLFGDADENNLNNYENITLFRDKYKSLIQYINEDNIKELNEVFIEDTANLIYLLEQKRNLGLTFIQKDLMKLLPTSLNNKIFLKLISKFKKLPDNIIEEIAKYFSGEREKDNIKCETLINNFQNIDNTKSKCKKFILNKISNSLIIDKNMILYEKEKNQIKVLIEFNKLNIFTDPIYEPTQYVQGMKSITKEILDYIINFQITYSELTKMEHLGYSLNEILNTCIEILDLTKKLDKTAIGEKVEKIIKCKKEINGEINSLNTYLIIDQTFFEVSKHLEITDIEKLLDILKNKNLLEYEKEENKKKFMEYKSKYTEKYIEERLFLHTSEIFKNIYKHLKKINQNSEESQNLFKKSLEQFESLKYLLTEKIPPNPKIIRDDIFEVCLETVRSSEFTAQREISIIQKYFNVKLENKDFEEIGDNLQICAKKNEIIHIIKGIELLLDSKKALTTDFLKNLKSIKDNLCKKNFKAKDISNYLKTLSNINFKIFKENKEQDDISEIFILISNKPEAFLFLTKLKEEDCRNFQEMIDITDNNFLTLTDIQDLDICRKFLNDVGNKKDASDEYIINSFIQNANNKKNILLNFQSFFDNYYQFKELKSQKLDKIETNKTKSQKIANNSKFELSIKNDSYNDQVLYSTKEENAYILFKGKYFYSEDAKKKEKNIFFYELQELREIYMLNKNKNTKEETKILEYNKKFTENIKSIINIYYILEKIAKNGYHESLSIHISIQKNDISYKINNIFSKDYTECKNALYSILDNMEEAKSEAYKDNEYELIKFLYGKQFSFIFNCIKEQSYNRADTFLNYLTNNLYKNKIKKFDMIENFNADEDNRKNDYMNIINNCKTFIQEVLELNNLTIKDILTQNIITNEFTCSGFYNELALNMGIEETILNYYNLLTKNYPIHHTLLICNRETSSDEINSFMHRAILCPYNVLFMLGKVDKLSSENCQLIIDLITELSKKKGFRMKSCLVFVYSNNNSEIVRYLEKSHYKTFEKMKIKNLKENIFQSKEIEIYYSERSGLGKSTKIRKDAERLRKKYIYFPLGGEFNGNEVFWRLKKTNLDKNSLFHLDLFDTEKSELLYEFLLSLLITKVYKNNDNIFYFDKEIQIKIELPYGFVDFFSKFPLLKMFKNKQKITYENLPSLIVSQDIYSDVQIICNYLRLYKNKELTNCDLYIPKISSLYFKQLKTKKDAEILSNSECKELIYEYIKIKKPNYYQINNFIKILAGQFKKFSKISELSVFYLTQNMPNLINQRMNLIKLIIENTQYFIEGSFDKLLNSQEMSYNLNIGGEYDIERQNQIAVEALSKPNEFISYNNIKTPLIFLRDNANSYISIISHNNSDIQSIKQIINLKENENVIPDYKNFSQRDFYKELKLILNLENPIDKNSPEKNNLNNIKDIVGYYVITADNFFKMLLLLLRIREKVPVIMMGETGCGKTSLIRKLDELLNNGEDKMKILNIHSGITNEKIIEFLFSKQEYNKMSIIEEAEELEKLEQKTYEEFLKRGKYYEKRNLWIFLDEINTCNSLGLISEMICKHSCNGIPLPDNIVFIGACNPYRVSKINEFDGLQFKKDKNSGSKLVYTVNPLPHCLLNYVINFGSLSKEDEIKYIENIIKEPIEKYYLDELEAKSKTVVGKVKSVTYFCFNWIFRRNQVIKRNFDIDDLSEDKKMEYLNIFETAKEAVIKAHNYIRDRNDVSSVSLREIRRFSLFYEYFQNYLTVKKKSEDENKQQIFLWISNLFFNKLDEYNIYKQCIILSIFMCYYLRIRKKEDRKEFVRGMNEIFKKNFEINFLDIPEREEEYIINNIQLPDGIAKNEALLNNVFVLFVCITAKVPLFIVGKPGCSKSLSVQLLFKSMKGEDSESAIFKNLPKLYINTYQGSLSSTSQGILKIFEKARRILKQMNNEDLNKIISMVFIDEMGLAEHSSNNPLKVLHSELEYDLNEGRNKIAFVGISNWKLDASKMNRGIYLSIPEPTEEDLKLTSVTIAESLNKSLTSKNEEIFINLAKTYHSYISELKTNIDKADFHGARDFYNLIKTAAKFLSNKSTEGKYDEIDINIKQNAGVNSLERNLAGLKFDTQPETTSLEKVKLIFQKEYNTIKVSKQYNVIERIKENINDLNNRYLLLVTNSPISEYLIYSLLEESYRIKNFIFQDVRNPKNAIEIKKEIISYVGSKFDEDQNSEEYILKMINKIQVQMEKNVVLILKDLESVYPSLYALFNQNFTTIGDKNYARLSVGYSNNTFSLVNNEFKCIVMVDEKQILKEEPPFLNRFEKHIIDFEYLLTKNDLLNLSYRILNIKKNLEEMKMANGEKLKYDISKLFINCNKEEIQGIIYYLSQKKKSVEDIEDFIFQKISMVLPQDIILLMNYCENNNMFRNEYEKIMKFYKEEEHSNLINHIKKCESSKSIIYTFSRILEPLLPNLEKNNIKDSFIETKKFGKLQKRNIRIISINLIDSENELDNEFDNFFNNEHEKLFIFKFSPEDSNKIGYLKNYIEERERNNNELKKKAYIFIIYLKRIFSNDNPEIASLYELNEVTTFLNEDYYQIFIDNLNGINENISNLLRIRDQEELVKKCVVDIDSITIKNIYSIFTYFNYTLKSQIKGLNINNNNYTKTLVEYISKSVYLKKKILKEIYKLNLIKDEELIKNLFINNRINSNSIDYITEISDYFVNVILEYLKQFIFKSEKKNILSSFLNFDAGQEKKILENKFIAYTIEESFNEINKDKKIKFVNEIGLNPVEILLGIKIPGIKQIIENIIIYIHDKQNDDLNLAEKLYGNENELRNFESEDENEEAKRKLVKNIEKILKKTN